MGAISSPAESILLADAAWVGDQTGEVGINGDSQYVGFAFPSMETSRVMGRHAGSANVSWFDGHAKSMPVDKSGAWIDTGFGSLPPAQLESVLKANNMGDILHAPYGSPGNASYYYYDLFKQA